MQAGFHIKTGFAGLCLIAVAACEDGALTPSGFKADYVVARNALEDGNYSVAMRRYARLIDQAGPLEPRIRLEYAHALLRDEQYAEASKQAANIAARTDDVARSAALAVQGTADHEQGLAAIAVGDRATAERFLKSADAAFTEVLSSHPGLDPLGAIAGRQASIRKILGS